MESQCRFALHRLLCKDAGHVSLYLLTICTFLETCLFTSFYHLLIGALVLLVLKTFALLGILDISPA